MIKGEKMKLIDLLVQELPKRGGWPSKQEYAWQDKDGEIRFSNTTDDDFYPNNKITCKKFRSPGYVFVKKTDGFVVTRKQYESVISAGEIRGVRIK